MIGTTTLRLYNRGDLFDLCECDKGHNEHTIYKVIREATFEEYYENPYHKQFIEKHGGLEYFKADLLKEPRLFYLLEDSPIGTIRLNDDSEAVRSYIENKQQKAN